MPKGPATGGTPQVGGQLADRAFVVAAECQVVAKNLAHGAERAKRNKLLARSVNVLVGALAVSAAFISPLADILGPYGVRIVSAIAAVVLILDGLFPLMFGEDTYERLSEYSMYIYSYSGMILNTLADEGLAIEVKRARLTEVLLMATRNLDDVRSKWPWSDEQRPNKQAAAADR